MDSFQTMRRHETMDEDKTSIKIRDFIVRFAFTLIAALAIIYYMSRNWKWYTEDLPNIAVHPQWANPTVNLIIWGIWMGLISIVWPRHAYKHADQVRMDLLYPILLVMVFITWLLFFEMHDLGSAKWFGIISVFLSAYILYEGFLVDQAVSWTSVITFSILIYSVAQFWYYDKNRLEMCVPEPSCPPCSTYPVRTA